MTWKNFTVSSSITYNYTILPEKSGTYKIPPQSIRAGKDNLQTPELTLRVADSPRAAAGTGSNRSAVRQYTGWRRKDRFRRASGTEKDRLCR